MYAPELKGDSDEITLAVADWAAGRQGRGQKGGDLRLGRKGLIEAGGPREEFTCRSTLFRGKRFQATECLPQPNPLDHHFTQVNAQRSHVVRLERP